MTGRFANGRRNLPPPEPDGAIRVSQLVTTFGPGAMVDLVNDAVLISGLDFWRFHGEQPGVPIDEPRLFEALRPRLSRRGLQLNPQMPFREPPAQQDEPDRRQGVAAFEFPRWVICQNPQCRALVRADHLERKGDSYVHACDTPGTRPHPCVPVRFVMACERGHIEDLPWIHWVHEQNGKERCASPQLRFEEESTGDFGGIRIICRCGAERALSNAMAKDANPKCGGHRPWLGPDASEPCGLHLRLLVRTASNSYFAQVESALWLPEEKGSIRAAVESVHDVLGEASREDLPILMKTSRVRHALGHAQEEEVWAALESLRHAGPAAEPIRTAEFRRFARAPEEQIGELPQREDRFFIRAARFPKLPFGIERVVLASKLREVRVELGFTRFDDRGPDLQGEYDLGVESAILGRTDWLPATEIRGEGVFLQLSEQDVHDWEQWPEVVERERELLSAYKAWAVEAKARMPFPGVRFYLLHSLAHLLINAMSLECGYPASAIRERIYCSPATDPVPMAALLLMTGSAGAEGTLGGLVDQGRRIEHHLNGALELGRLCSNDPVCAFHKPGDPSDRPLEGAACHGCLFVAECSCERFNRFLDRALVVPTLGCDRAAFWQTMT